MLKVVLYLVGRNNSGYAAEIMNLINCYKRNRNININNNRMQMKLYHKDLFPAIKRKENEVIS
jgi:hypothetical protein